MNIVFLGGGSLRILPIIRALLQTPEVFDGGSIRLVDLKIDRAEAVGKLIQRCPEYRNVGCRVQWTSDLDKALDGADIFYLTTTVEREPGNTFAALAADEYGYLHSDQLSVNGAFLAARAGGMVMNFARKMEKYCPQAMMLIFANPVSVFSAAVNSYTKINALGVCAGFGNHRWDLPRLCGRDCCEERWRVVAAGVNHLSFILRGELRGRDMNDILREHLSADWRPTPNTSLVSSAPTTEALRQLSDFYRRFGIMVFSAETDGLAHLFMPQWLKIQHEELTQRRREFNPATVAEETATANDKKFAAFIRSATSSVEPDWQTPFNSNPLFGIDGNDVSVPIIRALAGLESMQVTVSRPNRGAVRDFPDNAAMEYTMTLYGKDIVPAANLYIPSPFKGLIASLAEHQTLLADAVAQQSGRLFADALEAYPMNRGSELRKPFFHRMFDIFSDLSPALAAGRKLAR